MRTKLACTIGPASGDQKQIRSIMDVGCSIFRINLSHGVMDQWNMWASSVREAAAERGGDALIITDLKGPSVRLGGLPNPKPVRSGERLRIALKGVAGDGAPSVDSGEFFKTVSVGDVLVTDDGRGLMEVYECGGEGVAVKALTDMILSSGKSLVVRGKETPITDYLAYNRDQLEAALSLSADFIGLSFVRTAADVEAVRRYLPAGQGPGLISKVETPSAVANVEEIAEVSDAVLVARGDLGMHFPLETVPRLQRKIIESSLNAGRPVIVATQLLGSMMSEPIPSRSEVVDIMSCVEHGVDVLMLTGETAVGRYPVEAVRWLRKVVETYEDGVQIDRSSLKAGLLDRFALGVVELAEVLGAKIGVYTKAGNVARRISRYKPRSMVFAGSGDRATVKMLMLLWGVTPLHVDATDYGDGLDVLMEKLRHGCLVEAEDTLVLTYGLSQEPVHIIRIVKVG
ncbi:MAG: pyruvate kinase [Nitrososphaerota archaeon]